ncbi:hypothetical protein FACS1894181_06680 [Bacteroidia bacterium]|nr:hypothetical protein FACS1894181_06680 [Bacteroidia bacterium]
MVNNDGSKLVFTVEFPKTEDESITAAAIGGVTAPVANELPSTGISNGTGFASALSWNSTTFGYATAYTATITLTAASDYTFAGFTDVTSIAGFTVNSNAPATLVSNNGTTLVFTVEFPKTADEPITAAAISGVTSPVAGATPSTGISNGTGFASALSWNSTTFGYATAYTATITLTAESDYTFAGNYASTTEITGFTVNSIEPAWVSNDGSTLVFTVTFPATAPAYGISVGSSTGGSVSANKTLAAAGETVTLTVTPDAGDELSAISVFKTGDASVTVSVNGFNGVNGLNGDFTMPAFDVTVSASFSENLPPEPDPDAVALDAMIYSIRDLHVNVPQEEANTESEVADWLKAYLARLFEDKGWDISVQTLTVVNFFPATAGTRTDMPGTNGSFSFFAMLRKGYVTDRTYNMDGTVTATPYTIPTGNESAEVPTSVYFRNHTLYICSPVAEIIEVYSFSGAKLFSAKKDVGEAVFIVPANLKAVIVRGSSGWTWKTANN